MSQLKFYSKPRRANPEGLLQKAVVQHLKLTTVPGIVYFSVPNESKRSAVTAGDLKAKGMRPGASDLVIFREGRAYCLEIKAKGEKQTDTQLVFEADCLLAGVPYACVDCIDAAITVLRSWGVIKPMARAA